MNKSLLIYNAVISLITCICLWSCQKKPIENSTKQSDVIYSSSLNKMAEEKVPKKAMTDQASASATGIQPAEIALIQEPTSENTNISFRKEIKVASPADVQQSKEKNLKSVKKELKKEIRQLKNGNNANYALFSKATGVVLIIGGLILIILGIAFLNSLGVLLGSIIAGLGVIVFLLGFLGLIL